MKTTTEIRSAFLDYFRHQGHEIVESSSLVPSNDPTLLFTNAGMVQFKNVFTGAEKRPYATAATSQKCVRAGGKHNDLENVGYTARHHTFFEMLGNFSFGDYFKERAIDLAWTLVTRDFALPKDRLLVTVYAEDDDAATLWKKIAGLSDDKIIRIATSDNFWAMGDTGPCGPCSEIFFDHGPGIAGGPPGSPDADGDRFIEIWNLVFMQFEQRGPGDRAALPRPSIDTGMGLERVAAVLQGKHDNYDIDLMRAIIEASADAANGDPDGPHKTSHRVIADHLRASSFLIADGVLPSNEGRGYVLRRIMRRAMRHAHMIGCTEPHLHRLVPALVRLMGGHFPELVRAEPLIRETLALEESRFEQLLERGLRLLDDETARLGTGQPLSGATAFKLYDTFGFPLDLTQDILRAQGRAVDTDGFNAAMAEQRAAARRAWAGSGDASLERIWFDVHDAVGATEFLGYSTDTAEGVVTAIIRAGQAVQAASIGEEIALVVNQTPFYAESGGQQGDRGTITGSDGAVLTVTDTQKKQGAIHAHLGTVAGGAIRVGDKVHLAIDTVRRDALRAHHSSTHLLHEALRRRLGDHVTQKGSLVAPDRLRFDFSHPRPLSAEDIAAIEADVNARIRANGPVTTRYMTPDEAIAAGALALFGEKYGDEVRVVSMGPDSIKPAFSTELCGGTHVRRTGDISLLKIVSESAVSSGVRRIEAVAAETAEAYLGNRDKVLEETTRILKLGTADEVPGRVASLLEDRRKLEREISDLRHKLATGGTGAGSEIRKIGALSYAGRVVTGVPAKDLKPMVDTLKGQIGTGVAALISVADGKASLVVGVTEDATQTVSAVDLVRVGSDALGGKGGGGRPDMAQAGGPDGDKAESALDAIAAAIAAAQSAAA